MKSLRFNPFKQVHQGLRALLYDTAIAIQQTNFTNEEEAGITIQKMELVLTLFHGHAEVEDSMVFPAISVHAPDVVKAFEAEHVKDEALATELEQLMNSYRLCNIAESKVSCGISLLLSFNEFVAFNLQHMNREEIIVNNVLWQHFPDEALLKMVQEIGASIPPEKNQYYSLWMLKGNSNEDVINWLAAVKDTAPSFVYDNLYSLGAANLQKERWSKISNALNEPVDAD
jgi:hypothetical protein